MTHRRNARLVQLRVRPGERRHWHAAARRKGIPMAELVRQVLRGALGPVRTGQPRVGDEEPDPAA